jgi:hypothetical protein
MESRCGGGWVKSAAGAVLGLAALAGLAGCGPHGGKTSAKLAVDTTQCSGTFSDGSSINLANPTFLADVPGNQLFCDFHTFAWNQFVYLTQMQPDPNNPGPATPLFLHLAPWYNMLPQTGGAQPGPWPGGSTALLAGPIDQQQAGDQDQLLDVNGATVLYDIRFNDTFYNSVVTQNLYTEAGFDAACAQNLTTGVCANPLYLPAVASGSSGNPASAGALEVKTAWRDFGAVAGGCPSNFYCNGRFGLVGMHIVQKTQTHGEWIWASFEHVANAPDCFTGGDSPIPTTAPSGQPWSFFNPATAPASVFATQTCEVTGTPQCNANPQYHVTKNIVLYKPVNVCRTDTVAAGGASAANCAVVQDGPPQQNSNSRGNVACLNASMQKQLSSVWSNYKMIGSLWVRGQTPPTQDFRIQIFQPAPAPAAPLTPYGQPVGFPHLANTTMETWLQSGSTGYDPFASNKGYGTNATTAGCFLCHNLPSSGAKFGRSDDLSHFPARLDPAVQQARRATLVAANSTKPVDKTLLAQPVPTTGHVAGIQPVNTP